MASSKSIVQSPESYKLLKKYIIKYTIKPEEAIKELENLAGTTIV